jgi:hypothetical protein
MAKYTEVSDDTMELFEKVLNSTTINQDMIRIKILNCETEKTPMKIMKANDLVSFLAKDATDIIVIVNENLLDLLQENNTEILLDELLSGIGYDSEKDKILFIKPTFNSYPEVMKKYGNLLLNAKETVRLLLQQKEDEAREAKQAKLEAKKNKKK